MQLQLFWGGLWPLLCKNCRQTMNLFPLKRKKRKGKRPPQSKESLVDLFKEYQLEQKLKEEEREKNFKEMHLEKMCRFDRLLDLYEKDISK